jgi:hypothetical protein
MKFWKNLWYGIVTCGRGVAWFGMILWLLVETSATLKKDKNAPNLDKVAILSLVILATTEEDVRKRREEKKNVSG